MRFKGGRTPSLASMTPPGGGACMLLGEILRMISLSRFSQFLQRLHLGSRSRPLGHGLVSGAALGILLLGAQAAFFAKVGQIKRPTGAADPATLTTEELYGPLAQVLEIPARGVPMEPVSPYAGFAFQPTVYTGLGLGMDLAYSITDQVYKSLPDYWQPTVDHSALHLLQPRALPGT